MTRDKMKKVMDAFYLAKRARDLLPNLPNGVTPSHIHYLDTTRKLELKTDHIKVSDISDVLGLPRPSVTKTIKDMEMLGFVEKKAVESDRRVVEIKITKAGRDLVDEYVDRYFGGLSAQLDEISDQDADIMIKTIEKVYEAMRRRQ